MNKLLKKRQAQGDTGNDLDNLILLGADAEALYPSLQKNITAQVVAEEVIKSTLNFQDVDHREMGRYIYLILSAQEHQERGITHLIPSRNTNGSSCKLTMKSKQMLGPHKPKETEWNYPYTQISNTDCKKLLAACCEIVVKVVFSTHCYKFAGKSYNQSDGGPIGLRVTNALAKIRIANWAGKVSKYLEDNGVKLYLMNTYVDDI